MPAQKKLNHNFFKDWSPGMAYVLGYFAADGSMIKNKPGKYSVEFTSTDRILLSIVQRVTASQHRISKQERGGNTKPAYRIQIGSKEWVTDLESLGFSTRKSKTLSFPTIQKEYSGDFIRGYFDGDGCVYFKNLQFVGRKRKRWILMTLFTSGSSNFLESLHAHLLQEGVRGGSLKKKKRGFELVLSHKDSVALYKLMYHTISATGLYLPRKYILFKKALQTLYPSLRL
jgi:intein-encoded DNA endonuclease-like protein